MGPVAMLDAPGAGDDPAVDREQVRLRQRARVGHRDAEQHLALALRVAERPAARDVLRAARITAQRRPAR